MSVKAIRFAFLAAALSAVVLVFACVDVSNYLEGGSGSDNLCAYPGGASVEMDEEEYELDAAECEALDIEISVEKVMASTDMTTFLVEGEYDLPDEEDVYYIWHIGRQQSNCYVEIDGAVEEKSYTVWSRYVECPSSIKYNVVQEIEAPADDDEADDDEADDDIEKPDSKADDDDTDNDDDDDDDGAQWEPDVICSFTIDLLAECPSEDDSDDGDDDDDDDDDDTEED